MHQVLKHQPNELFDLASKYMHGIRVFTTNSLNIFNNLPKVQQNLITNKLKSFICVFEDVLNSEAEASELEKFILRKSLQMHRLKIPDDFYSKLSDGDIIEVYDASSMTQLYRNLEFLKMSSYDLLTIEMNPFFELFDHEIEPISQMMARIGEILKANEFQSHKWNIEPHYVTESKHQLGRRFRMELKHICQTRNIDSDEIKGFATCISVKYIDDAASREGHGKLISLNLD